MDIHVHTHGKGTAEHQDDNFARQCLADWQRNPNLQREFVSFENYVAYKRAEVSGKVRVLGRGVA